jgi:2-phosphoglycerate kinase
MRDKLTHFKGNSSRLLEILDKYLIYQDHQCEQARQMNIPVVSTDNWDQAREKVLDIIFERIEKLNNLAGQNIQTEAAEKIQEERQKMQKW